MFAIVIDGICGGHGFTVEAKLLTVVQVSIETREVAATHLEPQSVSLQENIRSGPQVDGKRINLSGRHHLWLLRGISIPRPHNAFGEILRKSVGPDINQLGSEIGINGRGFGEQLKL